MLAPGTSVCSQHPDTDVHDSFSGYRFRVHPYDSAARRRGFPWINGGDMVLDMSQKRLEKPIRHESQKQGHLSVGVAENTRKALH